MANQNLSYFMKLRYACEYAVLRAVAATMRALPLETASRLMGWAWSRVAPLTKRHAHALENLERAYPDMSAAKRERVARGMWNNLGRVAAESFQLDRLYRDKHRYTLDVEDARTAGAQNGGACVLVSLHTGNWELVAQPAADVGLETAAVYQALKNPYADRYLSGLRHLFYPAGLYPKSHSTARKLVHHVRDGGAIAFLADQRDVRGVQVPFFGHPAWATPFPVMVARTYNVPLLVCRTIRRDGVNFQIEAKLLEIPRDGDRQADIREGTARVHEQFERWIREYPEQWMWIHRKWDGKPPKKRKNRNSATSAS